jgi:hypothetical protein
MPEPLSTKSFTITVQSDGKRFIYQPPGRKAVLRDIKQSPENRQIVRVLCGILRDGRLHREEEFKCLGTLLYSVLFDNGNDDIGEELIRHLYDRLVRSVRIQLEFEADQQQAEHPLASWPWEYLYCPDAKPKGGFFLGRRGKFSLTRHVQGQTSSACVNDEDELRILLIASGPKDYEVECESLSEKLDDISSSSENTIKVKKARQPKRSSNHCGIQITRPKPQSYG